MVWREDTALTERTEKAMETRFIDSLVVLRPMLLFSVYANIVWTVIVARGRNDGWSK